MYVTQGDRCVTREYNKVKRDAAQRSSLILNVTAVTSNPKKNSMNPSAKTSRSR